MWLQGTDILLRLQVYTKAVSIGHTYMSMFLEWNSDKQPEATVTEVQLHL